MRNYFKRSEFKALPADLTAAQALLFQHLKKQLNIIRAEIDNPIYITSCYRTIQKYRNLIKRGYFPSATSDHFWGQAVPTQRPKDKKKYGAYFTLAAGAVDISVKNLNNQYIFQKIVELNEAGAIELGQVIYESRTYPTPATWVHLGNPRTLIFNECFLHKAGGLKQKYLQSFNGGRTYQIFN